MIIYVYDFSSQRGIYALFGMIAVRFNRRTAPDCGLLAFASDRGRGTHVKAYVLTNAWRVCVPRTLQNQTAGGILE